MAVLFSGFSNLLSVLNQSTDFLAFIPISRMVFLNFLLTRFFLLSKKILSNKVEHLSERLYYELMPSASPPTLSVTSAVGSLSVLHQYVIYADAHFTEHGLAPYSPFGSIAMT